MKIIFLGTPQFAVPVLSALSTKYTIVGVVTQTDKLGNRNKLVPPPVKVKATELGLPIFQFKRIRNEVSTLRSLNADLMVTCAYGQLLTQDILDICPMGVYNVHASLLPRLRGASPINHSILQGDSRTGVTIMRTVLQLDAGEILLQDSLDIGINETAGELTDRLSVMGADLIINAIDRLESGKYELTPQDEAMATMCGKIKPDMERIDWTMPAQQLHNHIRALSPVPAMWTTLGGQRLKIYKTEISTDTYLGNNGQIVACNKGEICVKTSDGSIIIKQMQFSGGKILSSSDLINGRKVAVGDQME